MCTGRRAVEDEHGFLEQIRQAVEGIQPSSTSSAAQPETDSTASRNSTDAISDHGNFTDPNSDHKNAESVKKADSQEEGFGRIKKQL